jgi:hypothetical protein
MGLIFSATILLSAALMFIVEPMFAKMVLPLLGGSPSVWNTCLVFYQAVLLAGYVYAHLSLKWLGPRRQAVLHIALLGLAWISLPIAVAEGWAPPSGGNPAAWLLGMLTVCVGLPFLCISASAPLLQAWFAYCGGRSAKDPYFLYAASNLGSLGGLAAYPLLIEPRLTLISQTEWWSKGYGLLMALFALCAVAVRIVGERKAAVAEPAGSPTGPPAAGEVVRAEQDASLPDSFSTPVTLLRRLWWLALALVPSALLMGVTAHLSMDLAPMPLLWAIPLGLYLLSFIVVFARWPILRWLWLLRIFQIAGLAAAAGTVYIASEETSQVMWIGGLHLAAFFLTALVCHGAMAADRPASEHLTEFYLWMSAGGVAGGLLCALLAPQVFNSVMEYPLMLVAACLLCAPPRSGRFMWLWRWSNLALAAGVALILVACAMHGEREDVMCSARSFFGVLRVVKARYYGDWGLIDSHKLFHGTTLHGEQSTDPDEALEPWTYFEPSGPVGDVFDALNRRDAFQSGHIGIVGLGTGTAAAYARPGQSLTYFEIDAAVRQIAEDPNYFTYLANCRERLGDNLNIRMGDARLTLKDEKYDNQFDLLMIDAFSSDSIPIHLITRQAVEMYLKKLAPGGLLVMHVTNRHLDLPPVVAATAKKLGLAAQIRYDFFDMNGPDVPLGKYPSEWAVLARTVDDLGPLASSPYWGPLPEAGIPTWTDDYSSIVSVMDWSWLPSRRTADIAALVAIGSIYGLAIFAVTIAGVWKTFEIAGQPGWASLVPFYNVYVMLRIAGRPSWWLILFLVPVINIYVAYVMCIDIARNFGKGTGFGVGLAFLGFIFFPILGLGGAQYQAAAVLD